MSAEHTDVKKRYRELLLLHGDSAYYGAYTILHKEEDAEAAVLEGFRRLMPYLHWLETENHSQMRYLIVLLTRHISARQTHPKARKAQETEPSLREESVQNKFLISDLSKQMFKLPASLQTILILRYHYDFTLEEIGRLTDFSQEELSMMISQMMEVLDLPEELSAEEEASLQNSVNQLVTLRMQPYLLNPPAHLFSKKFRKEFQRQGAVYRRQAAKAANPHQWKYYLYMSGTALLTAAFLWVMGLQWGLPFLLEQTSAARLGAVAEREQVLHLYAPQTLPEGYILSSLLVTDKGLDAVYTDAKLKRVSFSQMYANQLPAVNTGIVTPVWGVEGMRYTVDKQTHLQWAVGESGYLLTAEEGTVDVSELVGTLGVWAPVYYESDVILPENVTAAQAGETGCVVLTGMSVTNGEKLEEFVTAAEQGKTMFLQVYDERSTNGVSLLRLYAAGGKIRYVVDNSRQKAPSLLYEEGIYKQASILKTDGKTLLMLYAQGQTEPKHALEFTG